jgi:hypothetical protein
VDCAFFLSRLAGISISNWASDEPPMLEGDSTKPTQPAVRSRSAAFCSADLRDILLPGAKN